MKPPVRTRSAPSRYDVGPSAGLAPARVPWTAGEKRRLIRALKAQAPPGDLQAELLREHLPRRTAAEILAFVHQLKGRVAREAIRTEYRRCREEQRRKRAEILAPIEVWTDLAEKLTDKLEETMTAAFSQVLTVAATEPVTLLHSLPQKLTRAAEKKAHSDSSSQRDALPAPANAMRNGAASPEPPAAKSAVVLDLLMSLPEELSNLDYAGVKSHMQRSYKELTAQQPEGSRKGSDPGAGAGEQVAETPSASVSCETPPPASLSVSCMAPAELAKPSDHQERTSRSGESEQGTQETSLPSVHPSPDQPSASHGQLPLPLPGPTAAAQKQVWKDLGVCPLNLFLLPLELLSRKGDSVD
ncbi:snRNA-activating protein complex subunit 2 isoform X3 [Pelodiscus sinensis]|uniref:snRNA-activating protein complex subunit 2 isoform X3 n=1 Tax=Pelodiscus sinensis TaxID=13735 RepID=UPI003F6C18BB